MSWKANGESVLHAYDFTYDGNGRLSTSGSWSYYYNAIGLPSVRANSGGVTRWVYAADGTKLSRETLISTAPRMDYVSNLVYKDSTLNRILVTGGYIDMTDSTPAYRFYVMDHQGNVRLVTDATGTPLQVNHYDPFGNELDMTASTSPVGGSAVLSGSATVNPYKYSGKEWDGEASLYDFSARMYDPTIARFTTMDPLCEKYYSISPYAYCAGNPVNLVDPNGLSPIYDRSGAFLGTDDEGLRGRPIIMSQNYFIQGMAHKDALIYNLGTNYLSTIDAQFKFLKSYYSLQNRPDYDGYVSIEEGILWAKDHPNAIKTNRPEDALYIDASKLDFGSLSTDSFKKTNTIEKKNVFRLSEVFSYIFNSNQRHTAYALGQVYMELVDRDLRLVRIINGRGTVYDWDINGSFLRKLLIWGERMRAGLNDNHGFPVYYYGLGQLKQ